MPNKLTTEKKIVDINHIVENLRNPNRQSDFIYQKMKKTIEERGLFGSIICRPQAGCYQIIDGHHRYKACKELGFKELPIEVTSEMSDNELDFWSLYFNNTKGKDDIEKVSEILGTMNSGQVQLLPWTENEIENTKQLAKFDFSQYETSEPELPANEMINILSFKFNSDEWKVVQEAITLAKQDGNTEKQWFMNMLGIYLRKAGVLSGFTN